MNLVTIKDLSVFLKVKESTLYSWVHEGTIPFYKLNGLLRFNLDEILEWVNSSKIIKPQRSLSIKKPEDQDINSIIKKAIEGVKGKRYNPSKRETSLNQGLRKEVPDGTV
ncbi:MAG: helix-turn-helix domain-containing protein [Deltaproteobacteria bacterium]|nr:helix-turn-helix domain-containing protein [Deltaproteobacteria bacterium]